MIRIRRDTVVEILNNQYDILVSINEEKYTALNYNKLTGRVNVGDSVILNTTAVHKKTGHWRASFCNY